MDLSDIAVCVLHWGMELRHILLGISNSRKTVCKNCHLVLKHLLV